MDGELPDVAEHTDLVASGALTGADDAVITFSDRETLDRILIFALRPPVYNGYSTPTAFTVDTFDEATWTTRATYTNATTSLTVQHQTATVGTNCQAET